MLKTFQHGKARPVSAGRTSVTGSTTADAPARTSSNDQEKLPTHHHHHPHLHGINPKIPHKKVKYIKHEGESGRIGLHPWHFLRICFLSHSHMSRFVNILWPCVPAAIACFWAIPDHAVVIFVLSYLAMVPCANMIGFAGQELARKLPLVFGVILETLLASVVEIVLFVALIAFYAQGHIQSIGVIRAAILGSILANVLLSLGFCFIAGGLRHDEQAFHEVISEAGNGLLLVAGFALTIPAAFAASQNVDTAIQNPNGTVPQPTENLLLNVSRGTAVVLIIAYGFYMFYQLRTHHSVYTEVLEADEQRDRDRDRDLAKDKLTFTECIIALTLSITFVALLAVFLVLQIDVLVEERGVPDSFMGLILVPLVEKAAEHLAAIDEAWDDQANFALAHVLGASLQTALFNTPIVVFVGWGLGVEMDLNFRPYEAVVLVLSIIVVGNFLRDGKSNYLEGVLCVLIYVIIAIAAFYYPNPPPVSESGAEAAARMLSRRAGL